MPEASYQWLALAIKHSHSVNPPRRWGWGETQNNNKKNMMKLQSKTFSESKKIKPFRISLFQKISWVHNHYQIFCLDW